MQQFTAQLTWIKPQFGGHASLPVVGLRPQIRFQKHVREWLAGGWDVIILETSFDEDQWEGRVRLRFTRDDSSFEPFAVSGALFELLDGPTVIAVGKIAEDDALGDDAS